MSFYMQGYMSKSASTDGVLSHLSSIWIWIPLAAAADDDDDDEDDDDDDDDGGDDDDDDGDDGDAAAADNGDGDADDDDDDGDDDADEDVVAFLYWSIVILKRIYVFSSRKNRSFRKNPRGKIPVSQSRLVLASTWFLTLERANGQIKSTGTWWVLISKCNG